MATKVKREAISAMSTDQLSKASANYVKKVVPKTDKERKLIGEVLANNFLFQSLTMEQRDEIIDSMTPKNVKSGEVVIQQGDLQADYFFVVQTGSYDFVVNEKKVGSLEGKGCFGELALLYNCPRAATVLSQAAGALWCVDRLTFQHIMMNASNQKVVELENFVSSVPLLATLNKQQRAKVAAALEPCSFKDGDYIIRQGDKGDTFYLLREGEVRCTKQDTPSSEAKELIHLLKGSHFGERALLNKETRAANVIACGPTECVRLHRDDFNELLGDLHVLLEVGQLLQSLGAVPLLASLTDMERLGLAKAAQYATFAQAKRIAGQGDTGDALYIVEKGEVLVEVNGAEVSKLHAGDFYGEKGLLASEVRTATYTAVGDVRIAFWSRDTFQKVVGHLSDILANQHERVSQQLAKKLEQVQLFRLLSSKNRMEIATSFSTKKYKKGDNLVTQGQTGSTFFVLLGGEVIVSQHGRQTHRMGEGDWFGENALLADEERSHTLEAATDATVAILTRAQATETLGNLSALVKAGQVEEPRKIRRASAVSMGRMPAPELKDLEQHKTLGAGSFGRVKLVTHKLSGRVWALKCLRKQAIEEMQQTQHIINEKRCLHEMDHPFLLKLDATYKDECFLYMLLEMIQGGELFSILADRGALEEHEVKFYSSQVVLAFEALQVKDYVYRDLKPENLMLDNHGYIKVVDFGFAKKVKDRTFTLCGTPDYLAPEIVACKGHNKAVDWWALGILIYELFNGSPPFANDNPMFTYKQIASFNPDSFKWPSHFNSDLVDLLQKLLKPNPALRYGCLRNGAADIKGHKWYAGMDWGQLVARKLPAPWKPELADQMDVSCFTEEYPDSDTEDVPYTGPQDWFEEF